jgi:hypothetical protein
MQIEHPGPMSHSWTISVSGRVYGPYSLSQMQGFHAEGRLADHSLVARENENQFHPAVEDGQLSPLFAAQTPEARKARKPAPQSAQASRYIIMAEMKSRSVSGLEEEIFSLGVAQRFMSQAWILVSDAPINTVRNALVQKLGKLDTLFIADAAHDKAAWFNFTSESDARVRELWHRTPEPQAKSA